MIAFIHNSYRCYCSFCNKYLNSVVSQKKKEISAFPWGTIAITDNVVPRTSSLEELHSSKDLAATNKSHWISWNGNRLGIDCYLPVSLSPLISLTFFFITSHSCFEIGVGHALDVISYFLCFNCVRVNWINEFLSPSTAVCLLCRVERWIFGRDFYLSTGYTLSTRYQWKPLIPLIYSQIHVTIFPPMAKLPYTLI